MRLTVLGKSPSFSDAGGACSGYLLEAGPAALVLDCGNGAFAKLREHRDHRAIDAVVLSHFHADHILDLVPYAYALTYGPGAGGEGPRLLAPPGSRERFRRLVGSWGDEALIESAFRLEEYDPAAPLTVGPLTLRLREVPHFTPAWAIEAAADGARLVYGADHGPTDALVDLARSCDLLVIEATLVEPADGHLTPRQAGEHGRRAGARRLMLTHFSDAVDADWLRSEAETGFGGPVELAAEGAVVKL